MGEDTRGSLAFRTEITNDDNQRVRATVSQCNNQAGLCVRVNELEIRDFMFTSGHVHRIAEFAVSGTHAHMRVHTYARVHLCVYYRQIYTVWPLYGTEFTTCGIYVADAAYVYVCVSSLQ